MVLSGFGFQFFWRKKGTQFFGWILFVWCFVVCELFTLTTDGFVSLVMMRFSGLVNFLHAMSRSLFRCCDFTSITVGMLCTAGEVLELRGICNVSRESSGCFNWECMVWFTVVVSDFIFSDFVCMFQGAFAVLLVSVMFDFSGIEILLMYTVLLFHDLWQLWLFFSPEFGRCRTVARS